MIDLTDSAIQAAVKAGEFLKNSFHTPHKVFSKEGKKNLVTECDLLAEDMILSSLRKIYPSHGFLCEESGASNKHGSDITWVIDPLDGTVNFAYKIPLFTVSIAACRGHEILTGVIFQPMTGELFVAEKGKGAFLNGNKIQVSSERNQIDALMAIEFPYNLHEHPNPSITPLISFLKEGVSIRRLGSAALNLAYIAAGRFDTFFEVELQPWDVAAGILLVEEAGGTVSQYCGKKRSPLENGSLLASNGLLHNAMLLSLGGSV